MCVLFGWGFFQEVSFQSCSMRGRFRRRGRSFYARHAHFGLDATGSHSKHSWAWYAAKLHCSVLSMTFVQFCLLKPVTVILAVCFNARQPVRPFKGKQQCQVKRRTIVLDYFQASSHSLLETNRSAQYNKGLFLYPRTSVHHDRRLCGRRWGDIRSVQRSSGPSYRGPPWWL